MHKEIIKEYEDMKEELSGINTQRGSSSNQLKGFYAECVYTTESNIDRIEKNISAREHVIDNNGLADAIIEYSNGQTGRFIQDKCGYTYSDYKNWLKNGKYDNMILRINKDHPIFSNKKELKELKELAKKHNVKIVQTKVTNKSMKKLADYAFIEGQVRGKLGFKKRAPITAEIYTKKKELEYMATTVSNNIDNNEYLKYLDEINNSGVTSAKEAAILAGITSIVNNSFSIVVDGEKNEQAVSNIISDVSSTALAAYSVGALNEKLAWGLKHDEISIIVNGTSQISKQIISYSQGEIDEKEFAQGVAETSTILLTGYLSGKMGEIIGTTICPGIGTVAGKVLGEMLTTVFCTEVINTIRYLEKNEKNNLRIKKLYHQTETEIKQSQIRLLEIVSYENDTLRENIENGYLNIIDGIYNNSYEKVVIGLSKIGKEYGLQINSNNSEYFNSNNLFNPNEMLEID